LPNADIQLQQQIYWHLMVRIKNAGIFTCQSRLYSVEL